MTNQKSTNTSQEVPVSEVSVAEVVGKLEDLVLFALECEKKEVREGTSFVQVYNQLQEVRKSLDLLDQDQKKLIALMEKTVGGETNLDQTPLPKEEQKLVEKLQRLQSLCEAAKERSYAKIKENPELETAVDKNVKEATMSPQKRAARRKDKFKPLGGKGGWVKT